MSNDWLVTMKPTFQAEWLALPPKMARIVLEKIHRLTGDPLPDGNTKKQLIYNNRDVYRLECGDYRIMYTLQRPYISLLGLRKRREDTYDEQFQSEYLGGYNIDIQLPEYDDTDMRQNMPLPPSKPLPEPITKELLVNLLIPALYHPDLLILDNEDDLLDCPAVPDEYKLKLHSHMFEKPLVQIFEEKDYLLAETNDLIRYKEGDLLGFLLKLAPEQEKFVTWGLKSAGPTLLKGGPGTGKSTIALHRVYELIQGLRKRGRTDFKILFTTYTNTLVRSSEQLLEQLLGDDLRFVEVQTADKLVSDILQELGQRRAIATQQELDDTLLQAVQHAPYQGEPPQQKAQRQFIERLNFDYLLQEILQVIVSGQISTPEDYLQTSRPGRQKPLNRLQRQAIWSVHEAFQRLLDRQKKVTWQHMRANAERHLARGEVQRQYDAVIIDEAQDLDPSVIRLLVQFCTSSRGLFITADANQSIYGSHFTWSHITRTLQLRGHTAVLQANYRSTREIGEAAQSYLRTGTLDQDIIERHYIYNGPLPIVRKVYNEQDEVQLLASFLTAARRSCRLSIGSCAILCPTEKAGRTLASALKRYNLEAEFMSGHYLDLTRPCIKVLTLNSAKGLEFPIVALAGFSKINKYLQKPGNTDEKERIEALALERRLLFVGMTRAMRALLVAVPAHSFSPLMSGFDVQYWNIDKA